jgi:4-amino-4-deoxy-L-arabinose transferase-like glycosyltransferase
VEHLDLTKTFSLEKTYAPAIICAGFALRLLVVLKSVCIEMDGIGYATVADQFVNGLFREGLGSVFSPMYPFFVSLLHLAVPDVELAGRLISLFFGTLLIWTSYLFAARLFRDRRKAMWTAALVAFHPYLVEYSGRVLSESLATFLFASSAFSFYIGWEERKRSLLALSGFCLVLTYLTRPEYLVFYAPFVLVLLRRRRVLDCVSLLLPFLLLGVLYVTYLYAQTGTLIVANRVRLSPFVTPAAALINLPFVSYEFMAAILPLFFLLAIPGFFRTAVRPYRNLTMLFVVFHILTLSFISHSTKRYSVEFVPLVLVFSVDGIFFVTSYVKRFLTAGVATGVIAGAVILLGMFAGFASPNSDRSLQKQAGLFLRDKGAGAVIAARLPLAAFYAKGRPVNLVPEAREHRNIEGLNGVLADRRVDYLVIDEEAENEMPFLREYLSGRTPIRSFGNHGAFVRIYRVS